MSLPHATATLGTERIPQCPSQLAAHTPAPVLLLLLGTQLGCLA